MYDDYLKRKVQYSEAYPNVNMFKNADRILEQKKPKKKQSRNQNGRNSMAQRTVRNKKYNTQNRNYLKELDGYGKRTKRHCDGLLDGIKKILNLVMIVGIALLGANKVLDVKTKATYKPVYAEGKDNDIIFSGLSTGHMSAEGKKRLKNDEGCVLYAYDDKDGYYPHKRFMPGDKLKGTLTIGYGHTGKDVKPGMTITQAQADALLEQDILEHENRVKEQLKNAEITTPISQKQFDAMVNYAFNYGSLGPKFLSKLKKGDYNGAAEELEVGRANVERMKRLQDSFKSDVDENNTLKSNISNINKVTQIEKKSPVAQTGGAVGEHKLQQGNVQISDTAKRVLSEINSKDVITSGMEGRHDSGIRNGVQKFEVVHPLGLKLDIIPSGGRADDAWADTAIAYIKHPEVAYVNFEDFTTTDFNRIKEKIFKKISPELQKKCNKHHKWFFGMDLPFLFRSGANSNTTGRHLDIGILPSAIEKTKKANKTTIKETEIPKNVKTSKDNLQAIKQTEKKVNAEMVKPSVSVTSSKPTTINIPSSKPKSSQPMKDVGQQGIVEKIRGQNKSYVQARK